MTESVFDYSDDYSNAFDSSMSFLLSNQIGNRFSSPTVSSPNFDGFLPMITASVAVRDVQPGYYIAIDRDDSITFYPVMDVYRSASAMNEADQCDIFYLYQGNLQQITYAPTTSSVIVRYEDWDSKSLGSTGWNISPQGNAIFTNIAARGRIEARSGYIGNVTSGWEIGPNLLSNASVGFYAPSAITGEIAIFAGAPYESRASAAFRVGYDGSINASSATITGNLTATTLDVGGPNGIIYNGSTVTIGSSVTINAPVTVNSLQVGASPTLLRIADDVTGTNDGIYINANNYWYSDGQFSVGGSANNAVWSGTTLTVTGQINATTITSSVGSIAGFTLANNQLSTASIVVSSSGGFRLGNPTIFSVDQFGNLVAQNASITGRINATSGSFSGDITAAAGRFTGSVVIDTNGLLYVGNLTSQRVVMTSSGIFAYHQNGLEAFALPISGSPRIGAFKIVPTGIVSQSASNANMILGNIDGSGSALSGIVLRGYRSDGASVAIYSIQNGVPTTYDSGDGFYVDENSRLKLKGATGSLAFDGNDLYISGNINARSGQFTGSVSAQYITASNGNVGGWNLSASLLTGNSASIDAAGSIRLGSGQNVVALSSTDTNRIWAGSAVSTTAPFRVSPTGFLTATGASIVGSINAQSGSFTGTLAVIGAGANIYAGTSNTSGARVLITPEGINGKNSVDNTTFYLSTGTQSLILDGGFENQTPNVSITSPWSKFWGNAGSAIGSAIQFYSGSESAMVGSSAGFIQTLDQTYTQVVNQQYSVNAWVLSSASLNITDSLVEIWVLESSTNVSPTYFQSNTTIRAVTPALSVASGVWTKISGTYISTAPSATISLRTYSARSTPIRVWWDAVEVSVGASTSNIAGLDFNEGAMYSDKINIDSRGFATFGTPEISSAAASATSSVSGTGATINSANFLTISGIDNTYRMWIGDSNPATAYLSVKKDGTINLNSGGDLALYSASQAPIGGAASVISKVNFYVQDRVSPAGQVAFFPSSSAMKIGSYTSGAGAGVGKVLIDTFVGGVAYSGSVLLNGDAYGVGTVYGNKGSFGNAFSSPATTALLVDDSQNINGLNIRLTNATYTSDGLSLRVTRTSNTAYNFITAFASATGDRKFRVGGTGSVFIDGSYATGGADYAEYFEWQDGNPNNDDRAGMSVILSGHKIVLATVSSDDVFGIVSTVPAVVGNAAWDRWHNKYLTDDLGRPLSEEYQAYQWENDIIVVRESASVVEKQIVSYTEFDLPQDIEIPLSASTFTLQRAIVNPQYNENLQYVPREDRPEWSPVGMVGKLRLLKGQPVNPRWIKLRDISENVEEWLVR